MMNKEWMKQISATTKENQQDVLANEFLRERAAVLARAGFAVEDALEKLQKIDRQIDERISILQFAAGDPCGSRPVARQSLFSEINLLIDQFNAACKKAEIQFYYLIVTREAMGLRRHETVQKLYRVPPRKKTMQAV
jgi:hypothetical protein